MEMRELIEHTKKQLTDTTGLRPVAVTRAVRDDQGWHIGLEMLELSRVPSTTDLLGQYDVLSTEDGHMVRFERKGTRLRGAPWQEETTGR